MEPVENCQSADEVAAKADRVKRTIIWVMAIFILLPFFLIWLTGAVRF